MFDIGVLMVVVLALTCTSCVDGGAKCDIVGVASLRCRLRTVAGAGALLRDVPHNTQRLALLCSEALFFESTLDGGFLEAATLPNLAHLTLDHCKIRRVPASAFARLDALQSLALRTHNVEWSATVVTELDADSFLGLGDLHALDLSHNNLHAAPVGVFCPLRALNTLSLAHNSIADVSAAGFGDGCNVALEVLDLSHNRIRSLPDDAFANLRSLVDLRLQHNALSTLGDRALFGLASLQILNFTENSLSALPPELFQWSREVRQFLAAGNALSVLAPGVFHGLEQLQLLDLSRNQLTDSVVGGDTFSGLVRIVVLNLAHNRLARVDAVTFRGMSTLQMLNLERNRIAAIVDGAFVGMKNLHALTLSHNELVAVEPRHFAELFVLNQLFLDGNRIERIDEGAFDDLANLQDLGLSANNLRGVPSAIRNLRALKSLDLGTNNISAVTNVSFAGLDRLDGLRLEENVIASVASNTFANLPSLYVLNLASNRIDSVARGAFGPNTNLRAVRLDGNRLVDIAGVVVELKHLGWLNVSNNRIDRFDYGDLPEALEWLDMHENRLTKLPQYASAISRAVHLKMLDVSHNRLTEISAGTLPNTIKTIYLNNNNISRVEAATFADKPDLQKVVLYGNALRTLDMNALALAPIEDGAEIPHFYIAGNPFLCDCTMEWLQRINEIATQTKRHPRVMDVDAIVCAETRARGVHRVPVLELKPSQFLCPYEAHCFAVCHCCDFGACDCKMTCPRNCTCYHDPTWTSNVVDCSSAGYEDVPQMIPMDATEIHLDGNDLRALGSHVFIGKKKLRVLYLNATNLREVHNRTFRGVESLKVLHLENNDIRELRGDEFDQLHELNELYLDHNGIRRIGNDTFRSMTRLEVLRLDDNDIVDFSPWQMLASSSSRISFEGNRQSCDCRYVVQLEAWLKTHPGDLEKMHCFNGEKTVADVLSGCINRQSNGSHSMLPAFIGQGYVSIFAGCFVAVVAVCTLIALVFAFRQDVRLWMHSKYGVRLFKDGTATNIADMDGDKLYDAYLVYGVHDEHFVGGVLAPELERSGYSLCLHCRDVCPSSPEGVACAASSSRRIVVVITLNFLAFEWSDPDTRTSILAALKGAAVASSSTTSRNRIVFVLTTEVSAVNLDPELQSHLRSHGVFYWGEKRFWDKLRFAMPDVRVAKVGNVPEPDVMRYAVPPTLNGRHRTLPLPPPPPEIDERRCFATSHRQHAQRGRTYFV